MFCVLLVILGGTIQVVHAHESANLAHSDCSLCTTAHLVSLAVVPAAILIAVKHDIRDCGFAETCLPSDALRL